MDAKATVTPAVKLVAKKEEPKKRDFDPDIFRWILQIKSITDTVHDFEQILM